MSRSLKYFASPGVSEGLDTKLVYSLLLGANIISCLKNLAQVVRLMIPSNLGI